MRLRLAAAGLEEMDHAAHAIGAPEIDAALAARRKIERLDQRLGFVVQAF